MIEGPWRRVLLDDLDAHVRDVERKPGPYRWHWVLRTSRAAFIAAGPAPSRRAAEALLREHAIAWRLRCAAPREDADIGSLPDAHDVDASE